MFAGIGGFRAGLTRAGGFQCIGHCEIDKYAEASYRAIHDIRKEERYYKQAGNSVTVTVIEAIGRRIRAVDAALRKEAAA